MGARRMQPIWTCLAITMAAGAASAPAPTPPARATLHVDLDGDGRRETLLLDGRRDPALAVRRGRRVLWKGIPRRWQPWKIATADVDGDGRREIILGVHKATRFMRNPHNCLFVYGWDGRRAFPKWLGSALSRPFTDFAFADTDRDGCDDLVAIELLRDGRRCATVYSWRGFGFAMDREFGAWKTAHVVECRKHSVVLRADGGMRVISDQ